MTTSPVVTKKSPTSAANGLAESEAVTVSATHQRAISRSSRLTVRDYMSTGVQPIASNSTMADAHLLIRSRHVRHLPVVDGTKIVGVVSLHDLHFAESRGLSPATPIADVKDLAELVSADAPLDVVARDMAARKHAVVVVMERGCMIGIFTTVDALRALADLAAPEAK